jgi:hypothetical protein
MEAVPMTTPATAVTTRRRARRSEFVFVISFGDQSWTTLIFVGYKPFGQAK